MKANSIVSFSAALFMVCAAALAQPASPAATTPPALDDAEVFAEPVPADIAGSAVAAVGKLGDEVVLGRYQVAVERMNPLWMERAAARMGNKQELDRKLAAVAAQMVQQGISMISFKPQGQPRVYQVSPGKKTIKVGANTVDKLVYTKWLVLVPTVTKFRIMREGATKPLIIENTSFQVAISDKGTNNWTFIDGAGLKPDDLRDLFITLPKEMELPPVEKREVR